MHEDSPDVVFPVALPLLLRFPREEDGGGRYIFAQTPLASPRCKPRDKTPRKYLGFGSRALSPTWYERESSMMPRTMAPWSIDESFPILLFEDNPTSVMYQQFIQRFSVLSSSLLSTPFLFPSLQLEGGRDETERFEYRSGKICSSCSMGLIYLRQVNGQYMGEEFSNILGDCMIPPRPSHTTFHQLLFTSKGLIVTHRD